MSQLFEEMAQGTAEARAYMEGQRKGYKVTLPESIDVRAIRNRLHLSQGRFADAFGLSVDAVRHWESGRRNPEAAARALLVVIAHDPQLVMRALAESRPAEPNRTKIRKSIAPRAKAKSQATRGNSGQSVRRRVPANKPRRTDIPTAVATAEASIARGEGRVITQESMRQLAEEIKLRGRRRLAAKQSSIG
jgi:putative transcriptional regulator